MNFEYRTRLSALIEAQHNCCALCGGAMDPSRRAIRDRLRDCPTIDHVMPVASGGPDGPGNIVAAHRRCNERKRDAWPTDAQITALERINATLGWATTIKREAA